MKLYGYYRSSTSYRTRIALNLKALEYQQVPVNLRTGEQQSASYKAVNPHQTVPALEVDGAYLTQSLALLDWMEANAPTPSFLPSTPDKAQICREFYYAIATEIHAPNNLSVLKYLRSEFDADQKSIEKWYAHWIHRTFEPIEARLDQFEWDAEGLPFGHPTVFEIVLIPQIYNARRWNTDLSAFPLLTKIDQSCTALPAFIAAHPDQQPDREEP